MIQKQISTVLGSSRTSQIGIQKGRQKRVKSAKSIRDTNIYSNKSRILNKNQRDGRTLVPKQQRRGKRSNQVQFPTLMGNSYDSQSSKSNIINTTKKGKLPAILQSRHCIRTSRGMVTTTGLRTNASKAMMKHTKIKGDNASSAGVC